MGAIGLVGGNLVYRTAPLATDAGIFALSWTLFALIGLMVIDRLVGKLIATVPAPTGQLGYRLLYGQVTRRWVLADISTTIRAGRILIAESVIIFVLFLLEREKRKTRYSRTNSCGWKVPG